MSDDKRRDLRKSEVRPRSTVARQLIVPARVRTPRETPTNAVEDSEFDLATEQHRAPGEIEPASRSRIAVEVSVRALDAPTARSESRIAVDAHERTPSIDSIQPVRVSVAAPRSVSMWSRAWPTAALVLVLAGGLVGVLASMRSRIDSSARATERDRASVPSPASRGGEERSSEPSTIAVQRVAPAAAPGITVPFPAVPPPSALPARNVTSLPIERSAPSALPVARTIAAEVGRGVVVGVPAAPNANNTAERVIVSSAGRHMTTGPSTFRMRAADVAKTPPLPVIPPPEEPSAPTSPSATPSPSPSPAASSPEAPGTSDAWVTEERRF